MGNSESSPGRKKRVIDVEIPLRADYPASLDVLRQDWETFLQQNQFRNIKDAPDDLRNSLGGPILMEVDNEIQNEAATLRFSSAADDVRIHTFVLRNEEASVEELEPTGNDEEWTAACESLPLPHKSLHSSWESLVFEGSIKSDLLEFAKSALMFSDKKVSTQAVHLNRLLLMHGPPGTGKTSLCRALAHKLSIRMGQRFPKAALLEIHSHSLFSKWFSTSGKLVHQLFELVRDMVQDSPDSLICVLIDEIESLASSRENMKGEPSDAMRAVNSLLTSLDRLKTFPNVLILATTNITDSVDAAFKDRADMTLHIDLPGRRARYEIIRSCLDELAKRGIIVTENLGDELVPFSRLTRGSPTASRLLMSVTNKSQGMSGRSLRRLPLQAHARYLRSERTSLVEFLQAIEKVVETEKLGNSPLDVESNRNEAVERRQPGLQETTGALAVQNTVLTTNSGVTGNQRLGSADTGRTNIAVSETAARPVVAQLPAETGESRKRKHSVSIEGGAQDAPKKKRGRPKGSMTRPKSDHEGSPRRPGRPKGSTSKPRPLSEATTNQGAEPKKRGRPKGYKTKLKEADATGMTLVEQSKKRGRPKGSKNKPKSEGTEEPLPPKRKAGRPKVLTNKPKTAPFVNAPGVPLTVYARSEQDADLTSPLETAASPQPRGASPGGFNTLEV